MVRVMYGCPKDDWSSSAHDGASFMQAPSRRSRALEHGALGLIGPELVLMGLARWPAGWTVTGINDEQR